MRTLQSFFLWLAFCFVVALPGKAQDQSQDESEPPSAEVIIEKNIEAVGGEMALLSIETIETKGRISHLQGTQTWKTIETFWKDSNWCTHYSRLDGTVLKVGSHRGRIWRSDREGEPFWVDDESAAIYKHVSRNPAQQIEWRKFDGTISVAGVEKIDGKDAWPVEFKHTDGVTVTRWFDVESSLIVQTKLPISDTWQIVDARDFRSVEGLTYPYRQLNRYPDMNIEFEMTMEKIEVNGDFDESCVELPKSLAGNMDADNR